MAPLGAKTLTHFEPHIIQLYLKSLGSMHVRGIFKQGISLIYQFVTEAVRSCRNHSRFSFFRFPVVLEPKPSWKRASEWIILNDKSCNGGAVLE